MRLYSPCVKTVSMLCVCMLHVLVCCSIQHSHLRQKNIVQVVGLLFRGSVLKGIVMEMMGKVGPPGYPAVVNMNAPCVAAC